MARIFTPLVHGFNFQNQFSGLPCLFHKNLKFFYLVHQLLFRKNSYGLCGGICFAALDYFYSGREIPLIDLNLGVSKFLHSYLFRRQNDTYGVFGKIVLKFALWTLMSDATLQNKTHREFSNIKLSLNQNKPVVLGLVYVHISKSLAIWSNHQVIAYSYQDDGQTNTLYLYDPNFPGSEDIVIELTRAKEGFECFQRNLQTNQIIPVRGFFKIPYNFTSPPGNEPV
jgi:hypothetical protein